MIVNGIHWTHPPIGCKLGYYGFDPGVMVARVDGVELTAWLRTTEAYDTYWTVRLELDGVKLSGDVNFVGREVALVEASELLAVFAHSAA